ncbi:hypothetical protein TRFO_27846 [Tritrichomonas foetus]|uniref:E2F/DP family winged-helix DNA-binding domain-containing protein n=1 Tax=Tritrichomonas foetus TaxID=1144522 RepID=A0A1J4K100_9EUKA|nr:hypothetical protein TRFO_27846 [Tritrichomonas foetus]|eukprot:OHT04634.1 hypothetical protein TRFO_27846 [Tritrichomonas foetus]
MNFLFNKPQQFYTFHCVPSSNIIQPQSISSNIPDFSLFSNINSNESLGGLKYSEFIPYEGSKHFGNFALKQIVHEPIQIGQISSIPGIQSLNFCNSCTTYANINEMLNNSKIIQANHMNQINPINSHLPLNLVNVPVNNINISHTSNPNDPNLSNNINNLPQMTNSKYFNQSAFSLYKTKKEQNEDLKTSIQQFVKEFENSPQKHQLISSLASKFRIKRRRLYDVINVLEAIGCCKRCELDSVQWCGRENIFNILEEIKKDKSVNNPSLKLCDLFTVPCCVGISSLTISFLLMFFALKQDRIDLRYVSHYFSRTTARYKTTLCKLYQICYILSAIGVTTRTSQVCEVILNHPYYNEDELSPTEVQSKGENNSNKASNLNSLDGSPTFSITSLLNHQKEEYNSTNYIELRRKELKDCFDEAEAEKNDTSDGSD